MPDLVEPAHELETLADSTIGLRRFLATVTALVLVAGLLTLVLVDFDRRTPEERLAAAMDAATEAGGVAMEATIRMSGPAFEMEFIMTGEAELAERRSRVSMSMTGDGLPPGFPEMRDVTMFANGRRMYLEVAPEAAQALGAPCISTIGREQGGEAGLTRDPLEAMRELGAIEGEVEVLGKERIRGVPTTHFRAQIDPAAAAEARGRSPEPSAERQATLPLDVWLDDEDRPRRMAMSWPAGPGTVEMTMEWFDYGRAVEIEMPTGCREVPPDHFSTFAR